MKTNVYIDAFNLYFGAVKRTPYRWLDIEKMCRLLLPHNQLHKIKYFTALVSPRPHDTEQPLRQQMYLRALKTIPNLEIIFGHFLTHEVTMPLAPPAKGFVKVLKTEEKGSDVNLATHLLVDAFNNDFEMAVVVSNDSDLAEPLRFVSSQLKKPVGILNPQKKPSRTLISIAKFYKPIRQGVLEASQFANILQDKHGQFHKPNSW